MKIENEDDLEQAPPSKAQWARNRERLPARKGLSDRRGLDNRGLSMACCGCRALPPAPPLPTPRQAATGPEGTDRNRGERLTRPTAYTVFQGRVGNRNALGMVGPQAVGAALARQSGTVPVPFGTSQPALNAGWRTELAAARPAPGSSPSTAFLGSRSPNSRRPGKRAAGRYRPSRFWPHSRPCFGPEPCPKEKPRPGNAAGTGLWRVSRGTAPRTTITLRRASRYRRRRP